MRRFTPGTDAISLSVALRGISKSVVGSSARTVAVRRRPEIRPNSPNMFPSSMGTVLRLSFGSISTRTEPSTMANIDEPISLRLTIMSPRFLKCMFDDKRKLAHLQGPRRHSKHRRLCGYCSIQSSTLRRTGALAKSSSKSGVSGGCRSSLPEMNSTTSWPWFMQCLISGKPARAPII